MADRSEKGWAIVGKIGVVIGIIAGSVAIYSSIQSSKPSLTAHIRYSLFSLPNDLLDGLKSSFEFMVADSLAQKKLVRENVSSEILDKFTRDLHKSWEECWHDEDKESRLVDYDELYTIQIENRGGSSANNVSIDVPVRGYASFILDNEKYQDKVKSSIPVGTLRPGQDVTVLYWATDVLTGRQMELIHVASDEGEAKTQIAWMAFGIQANAARAIDFIADEPFASLPIAAGLGFFVWIASDAIRTIRRSRKRDRADDQTTD